jgi:hypothetical protein
MRNKPGLSLIISSAIFSVCMILDKYKRFPQKLDWLFWIALIISFGFSVFAVIEAIKRIRKSPSIQILAILYIIISSMIIAFILITFGLIISLSISGFPPQD